jgi:hypothetical protein
MKIKCDRCKKLLKEPGALIFSPPTEFPVDIKNGVIETVDVCLKTHICKKCAVELRNWVSGNIGV